MPPLIGQSVRIREDADTDFKATIGHVGTVSAVKFTALNGLDSPSDFVNADQPYFVHFPEPIICNLPYDDGETIPIPWQDVWYNEQDLEIVQPQENQPSVEKKV